MIRRARLKRIKISNAVLSVCILVLSPVYPVFGGILYNISWGIRNFTIDEASILSTEDALTETGFISADIPLDTDHDWGGRREIETYVVQEGDTLAALAADFDLSRDTLRWANNLPANIVQVGQKLIIPPGDGLVSAAKNGETLATLASQYGISVDAITEANPGLSQTLTSWDLVYIPWARAPLSETSQNTAYSGNYTLRVLHPDGLRFVPGHCTYFVAKHWNVGWRGHAKDWLKNAQKAGYKTGQTARPWSIIVWYGPGYNLAYWHVGIVMSVNAEKGTMVVKDMNYTGLWKITTRTEKIKNKYILGFIYDEKK